MSGEVGAKLHFATGVGRGHQAGSGIDHLGSLASSQFVGSGWSEKGVETGGSAAQTVRIDLNRPVARRAEYPSRRRRLTLGMP